MAPIAMFMTTWSLIQIPINQFTDINPADLFDNPHVPAYHDS